MHKTFMCVLLVVVLLAAGNAAFASETNWFVYVQVGAPNDLYQGVYNHIGVEPDAIDAWDYHDGYPFDYDPFAMGYEKFASQKIDGITDAIYMRNFMSTADYATYPNHQKIWSFRVAGLSESDTTTGIKMEFRTAPVSELSAPVATSDMKYWLKLMNNQGQVVNKPAWAGGGIWQPGTMLELTVPTTANTLFARVDLQAIKLAQNTAQNMLAEGYEFEFIQGANPEPGSLLALSAGLIGLMGLVRKRS